MQGKIIKQLSNDYTVFVNNEEIVCKARGKFRKLGISPLVGDDVLIDYDNRYIMEILPRKNSLIRPAIANVDQAIIVTSVEVPEYSSNLLDKLITIIEFNRIKPILYFSKLDLVSNKTEYEDIMAYYRKIGYAVTDNFDDLISLINGKVTVLAGQSGAGKSTLLNKLNPALNIKTGEVSYALGRGKHTTRHTELIKVENGLVADTPGFSALEFNELTNQDIRDNFVEFNLFKDKCKYQDCMHNVEEDCYIKKMVLDKTILESRYKNYLNFINKR